MTEHERKAQFDIGYLRQAIKSAIHDLESDWERASRRVEWALQTLRDAHDRTGEAK